MKPDQKKIIFSTGGGKGGVGKSIFSVALGCHLAQEGNSVALVDLDLGGANLHTYLGLIKKTPTMANFILRKVSSLEEILLETSQKNLKLISGTKIEAWKLRMHFKPSTVIKFLTSKGITHELFYLK